VNRPNVVIVLADDLGYSDLGCYGGEIATPHLDELARRGVRFTQFYNTARCSPSRASLLTGRHPHETGIGILTDDGRPLGYPGSLSLDVPTVAEHLKSAGYATCLSGKWHLSSDNVTPNPTWPTRRGFDEFYGILRGGGDYFSPRALYDGETHLPVPDPEEYYFTDAVSDRAVDFVERSAAAETPFFLYLAYTAPHWPLHAPEEAIVRYEDRYLEGWDDLREKRFAKQRREGLLGDEAELSDRDPADSPWDAEADKAWQARRMAVYAAQVEIMDRGIGRVLDTLTASGVADDTLVVFLSDNGGCAEDLPPEGATRFMSRQPQTTWDGRPMQLGNRPEIIPGAYDTFASYGAAWANLSNTPFRKFKRWTHEGGIASPFIAAWPAGGISGGGISRDAYQLTDMLPTVLEAAGIPATGQAGTSLLPSARGETASAHPLYWEHIGNRAIRHGDWKAVSSADGEWELYDLSVDRSELHDRAAEHPELLERLVADWQEWADRVGVIPWERIREQSA
jgi:arylsulfatase A-like enzyme